MAAVNSRDKNQLEKRSSRRAWCTFGRHFLSSASARCAVAHVRLRWRRRRGLVAVGENFLFSSLAWQLGRRKGLCLLTWSYTMGKRSFIRLKVVRNTVMTTVWTISADSCVWCVRVKGTNTDVFLCACMYGSTILTRIRHWGRIG